MREDQARRGGRTELGSSLAQQQRRDRAGGARGCWREGEPLLSREGDWARGCRDAARAAWLRGQAPLPVGSWALMVCLAAGHHQCFKR